MTWPGMPTHNPNSKAAAREKPDSMQLYYDKDAYGHRTIVRDGQRGNSPQPLRPGRTRDSQRQYRLLESRHRAVVGARGPAGRGPVRPRRLLRGTHRTIYRTLAERQVHRSRRSYRAERAMGTRQPADGASQLRPPVCENAVLL